MTSSSDDEIIGAEAEQEYMPAEEVVESKRRAKYPKLSISQRIKLIDEYRQGKTDKFYNVVPIKNKPGEYRVIRRKKPLDVPIPDNSPEEINMNPNIPQRNISSETNDNNNPIVKEEFFTMQNTINNSLSKEIAAVMEKCNKIEAKMKKQKAKMKQQRQAYGNAARGSAEYYEPEYGHSYDVVEQYEYDPDDAQEYYEQNPDYYDNDARGSAEYQPRYQRFNARSRIDLRNFD